MILHYAKDAMYGILKKRKSIKMQEKNIIIFGGNSFLGGYLRDFFSQRGKFLGGTYYPAQAQGLQCFDLTKDDLNSLKINFKKAKYAIICAAITRPDACKENESESYEINVTGTKKLLEQLFELNIFPVFFSSEYVFNGEKGNYTETDELTPNTVYGSHKQIIENFLLKSGKSFLIPRLGKVFSLNPKEGTILTSIAKQLKNNETIKCAEDQIFCPTYVKDLAEVLNLALEKNLSGLYNMASPEYFSRFQIAQMIKSQLKIESGKIISCSIKEMEFKDARPLNTSLNSDKLLKATGFKFTKLKECINELKNVQYS